MNETPAPGVQPNPGEPVWRGPSYGLPAPGDQFLHEQFPATYNLHGDDGVWHDDERDADGDGLANWLEAASGPGQPSWWQGFFGTPAHKAEPWGQKPATICSTVQKFGYFKERPFAPLDMADPDVDGDRLLDGEDDQDNDDVSNIRELYEIVYDNSTTTATAGTPAPGSPTRAWTWTRVPAWIRGASTPFNPCAPNPDSRTCNDYPPF